MSSISNRPSLLMVAQQQISSKLAYARCNANLFIEEASSNLAGMLLLEPSHDLVGEHITESIYEFLSLEEYILSTVNETMRPYVLERVNRTLPSGETMYLNFTVSKYDVAVPEDNSLLLMVEDVTAYGQLEQAVIQERNELRLAQQKLAAANTKLRRLNQLKSLFFSMAAHDLRAPLMIIRGYAELVQSQLDEVRWDNFKNGEDLTDYLDTVMMQADWLDNIIHNVLDLHQLETNTLNLTYELNDLAAIARETIARLDPMARLNEQTLEADITSKTLLANIDSARMQQVFQNLISNAIKYTPPGGNIKVSVVPKDGKIIVQVSDTGRGMTKQQVDEAFELYYRSEDVRSSKIQGSGLGLFIVKTLIQAHKGDISAESTPGKGSTFTFWVPQLVTNSHNI